MAESVRAHICKALIEMARQDAAVVVLCSDSRGSASLEDFAKAFPDRFFETGIAEQNIVSIAAGLAHAGKKPFVASPASFLSTRALEQIKVDVAYSAMPVTLIGISGGFSYGPLGATHHSLSDIAALRALPGLTVLLPADGPTGAMMIRELVRNPRPAYMRIGRNAVPEVGASAIEIGKASKLRDGTGGTIIACGEMVAMALKAAELLQAKGYSWQVADMHTLKPLDKQFIRLAAESNVITLEEHSIINGLGAAVAQTLAELELTTGLLMLGVPDEPVVAGNSAQVRAHYGLDGAGVANCVLKRFVK